MSGHPTANHPAAVHPTAIHPTAIIDPRAKVPASCKVGPYCVIGPEVELGEGCELVSHVAIEGPSKIGAGNAFFPFCAIGMAPQDVSYKGEATRLEIGDHNEIRECVTISRGTVKGGGVTRVGSRTLIMAYAHIGHDSVIGDYCMLVNGATLAGHVTVEEWAVVGALCPVHQFVHEHRHVDGLAGFLRADQCDQAAADLAEVHRKLDVARRADPGGAFGFALRAVSGTLPAVRVEDGWQRAGEPGPVTPEGVDNQAAALAFRPDPARAAEPDVPLGEAAVAVRTVQAGTVE